MARGRKMTILPILRNPAGVEQFIKEEWIPVLWKVPYFDLMSWQPYQCIGGGVYMCVCVCETARQAQMANVLFSTH